MDVHTTGGRVSLLMCDRHTFIKKGGQGEWVKNSQKNSGRPLWMFPIKINLNKDLMIPNLVFSDRGYLIIPSGRGVTHFFNVLIGIFQRFWS